MPEGLVATELPGVQKTGFFGIDKQFYSAALSNFSVFKTCKHF